MGNRVITVHVLVGGEPLCDDVSSYMPDGHRAISLNDLDWQLLKDSVRHLAQLPTVPEDDPKEFPFGKAMNELIARVRAIGTEADCLGEEVCHRCAMRAHLLRLG